MSVSSAEVEYQSIRRLVAELTWLTRLLTDLSIPPPLPVHIHSDSQAAIHIARNPVFHERTKHVELDCHFVRQQYLAGLISLSFVPSKDQLADIFTKPLAGPSHHSNMRKLGLTLFPSNFRGDVEISAPSSSSAPSRRNTAKEMWTNKQRRKHLGFLRLGLRLGLLFFGVDLKIFLKLGLENQIVYGPKLMKYLVCVHIDDLEIFSVRLF